METNCLGRNLFCDVIADKDRMELDRLLDELTDFARLNDQERCFPKKGWTRESTRNFFHFHLNQRTIIICRNEGEIVGFVVWWRWKKKEILDLGDDQIFQNPPKHHADGDLLYISDVVTTAPHAMKAMCRELVNRNKDYANVEIWGTRQDKRTGEAKRVRYSRRLLDFIGD